jgi:hypothetical protein
MSAGLEFFPAAHRYKLDGKWVPGVTTLIGAGLPKPALMYWSAKSVAQWVADHPEDVDALRRMGRGPMVQALKEVPWQKRDDAAVRGTDIHALAEQLIHGAEVNVPEHIGGYVEACVDFLDTWKVTPLVVERPIANRAHWWAGTPDLFGLLPDGRTVLFDWKTGDSGIWPETAFQLAAYSHGEFYLADDGTEQPVPKADFCAAVWLQPGEYQVIPLKADDDTYNEFRYIARVAKAAKTAKGSKTSQGYVGFPMLAPGTEDVA